MVLLLARLGLRAPEVIAIQLDDIDWRSGEVIVRGEGNRHDRVPLPPDVGEALVDYINADRKTVLPPQRLASLAKDSAVLRDRPANTLSLHAQRMVTTNETML